MLRSMRNPIVSLLLMLGSLAAYATTPLAPGPLATLTVNGSEAPGDSGPRTVSFNGFSETVQYGQFSTEASLAAAFAAMFTRDYSAMGLYAKAGANGSALNVITFQLVNGTTFGSLDVAGPATSFSFSPSGFGNPVTTADTGTATLWFNGAAISTAIYGNGSTGGSIAQDLALKASSSLVTVTSEGTNLYLQSKQTGTYTGTYSITFSTSASFSSSPTGGTLSSSTTAAPVTVYSYNAMYDSADNVIGLSDSVIGMWAYTNPGYDSLNRISSAQAASGPYAGQSICWSYDNFGNRTHESLSNQPFVNQTGQPCQAASGASLRDTAMSYSSNNQISSVSTPANATVQYDSAGNVSNDGYNSYVYDGEGRLCAVNGPQGMVGYQYDADGNRIGKGAISSMSCDLTANGYSPTTDYVLDPSGGQMTEVSIGTVNGAVSQTWVHTNVTANGMLIATYDTTGGGLHFHLSDPLGSRRVQTDAAGFPEQTCQNLPFGNQLYCTGALDTPTEHHFTGLVHDTESGLDHAMFRQYASNAGRWMSPDPYNGSVDPGNPQSFNRYAYVSNMPFGYTDPSGLNGLGILANIGLCLGGTAPAACIAEATEGPVGLALLGVSALVEVLELFNHHPSLHASHTPRPGGTYNYTQPTANDNGTYTMSASSSQPADSSGVSAKNALGLTEFAAGEPAIPTPSANGNRIPGFTRQDGVCSTGPLAGPMNAIPSVLACCQAHDACYTHYQCNASSFDPRGPSGPCKSVCNANVEACITKSILPIIISGPVVW